MQRKSLAEKVWWWGGPEYFFLINNKPDVFTGTELETPWRTARNVYEELVRDLRTSDDGDLKSLASEIGEENLFLYEDLKGSRYSEKVSILRAAFDKLLEIIDWEGNVPKVQEDYSGFKKRVPVTSKK